LDGGTLLPHKPRAGSTLRPGTLPQENTTFFQEGPNFTHGQQHKLGFYTRAQQTFVTGTHNLSLDFRGAFPHFHTPIFRGLGGPFLTTRTGGLNQTSNGQRFSTNRGNTRGTLCFTTGTFGHGHFCALHRGSTRELSPPAGFSTPQPLTGFSAKPFSPHGGKTPNFPFPGSGHPNFSHNEERRRHNKISGVSFHHTRGPHPPQLFSQPAPNLSHRCLGGSSLLFSNTISSFGAHFLQKHAGRGVNKYQRGFYNTPQLWGKPDFGTTIFGRTGRNFFQRQAFLHRQPVSVSRLTSLRVGKNHPLGGETYKYSSFVTTSTNLCV